MFKHKFKALKKLFLYYISIYNESSNKYFNYCYIKKISVELENFKNC